MPTYDENAAPAALKFRPGSDIHHALQAHLRDFNALSAKRKERGADTSFEEGVALGLEMALQELLGVRTSTKLVDELVPGDRVWIGGHDGMRFRIVADVFAGRIGCPTVFGADHETVTVVHQDGTSLAVQAGFAVTVASGDVPVRLVEELADTTAATALHLMDRQ